MSQPIQKIVFSVVLALGVLSVLGFHLSGLLPSGGARTAYLSVLWALSPFLSFGLAGALVRDGRALKFVTAVTVLAVVVGCLAYADLARNRNVVGSTMILIAPLLQWSFGAIVLFFAFIERASARNREARALSAARSRVEPA